MAVPLLIGTARAGAEPYRFDDIQLGASYERLVHALDLRDIQSAIAGQKRRETTRPDLGRRGYGCVRREDAFADVACVSHDERVGGAETREIRLHFLDGILQQFSITAEMRHFDAVMQALRERYGAPQQVAPGSGGTYPSSSWRNGDSSIVAYGGKDLVFVSFELAGYAEAVKRRGRSEPARECR